MDGWMDGWTDGRVDGWKINPEMRIKFDKGPRIGVIHICPRTHITHIHCLA